MKGWRVLYIRHWLGWVCLLVLLIIYSQLLQIMEQVEGGDLIVNRGDESKPRPAADASREMHAADDLTMAIKLAQVN